MKRRIIISVFVLSCLCCCAFACDVANAKKEISIEMLGSCGDFINPIITFLALCGLVWQILQERKHHKEIFDQQIKQHKDEIELQRMTFLCSEHPIIQSDLCALTLYPLESSKCNLYLASWRFFQKGHPLRNPNFTLELKAPKSDEIVVLAHCRPGQLSHSPHEKYEVCFAISTKAPIPEDAQCTIRVLFQNANGGCFRFVEHYASPIWSNQKIPEEVYDKALSDCLANKKSFAQFIFNSGFTGIRFVQTREPIDDVPITESYWEMELSNLKMNSLDTMNFCQAIIDEKLLQEHLCQHLAEH